MSKKQLEPLIPEEQFGKMVAAISRVPKAKMEPTKVVKPRPKGPRRDKRGRPKPSRKR